jgi:hypothetical protein
MGVRRENIDGYDGYNPGASEHCWVRANWQRQGTAAGNDKRLNFRIGELGRPRRSVAPGSK